MLKAFLLCGISFAILNASPATLMKTQPGTSIPPTSLAIDRYDWNRSGVAMESSDILVPHLRWSFTVEGFLATGALAYDVNKDGKKEVFFGDLRTDANPRYIYSLDSDGNLLWKFPAKYDVGPDAIVDLDHDGIPELIGGEGAHQPMGGLNLYVINAVTGALIWKYTNHRIYWEEGFASSPVIYDVNGDGVDDLTLGSMDRYAYTFSGVDGTILWKSQPFEHYIRTSPPFADLNGDGEKDFIIWDNHAIARAYSIKTHALLWERRLGYGVGSTPSIGDLDGDGKPEIVFSLIVSGGIIVLRGDGSLLWQNTAWTYFYHSQTLVDVDGDGLLDVVQGDSRAHTIIAFRGTDGMELWHTTLPDTTWSQAALVASDIDGDGKKEILVGSDAGLYSLSSQTGKINWLYPAYKIRGEPRVSDIDGDGNAEIIFGAGDKKTYVIDQLPPPKFNPRTIGYWKHQCTVTTPKGDHVGMPQSFVDAVRIQSRVFSSLMTKDEACSILWGDYKSDMAGRAKQQLLALWLNVVSGFVDPVAPISLPKLTAATTVGGAIMDAENLILTLTDKLSLEKAKNICDSLNNGIR